MTRDELAALDAAARAEADDIAYYSGGSTRNRSLETFHAKLADLYRTGKLVMVPSVEDVARALMYADDLDPDVFIGMHRGLGHYGDSATAVLTSMTSLG